MIVKSVIYANSVFFFMKTSGEQICVTCRCDTAFLDIFPKCIQSVCRYYLLAFVSEIVSVEDHEANVGTCQKKLFEIPIDCVYIAPFALGNHYDIT